MTQGADTVRGAWRELRLDEHETAALLRLRLPRRQYRRWPAARKFLQHI